MKNTHLCVQAVIGHQFKEVVPIRLNQAASSTQEVLSASVRDLADLLAQIAANQLIDRLTPPAEKQGRPKP